MSRSPHLSSEQLSALLDLMLDRAEEKTARAHLEDCASCAERLEALARLGVALRSEAIPPAPAALRQRIRQQIPARRSLPRWAYGAAAVMVTGAMLAVLFGDRLSAPRPDEAPQQAAPYESKTAESPARENRAEERQEDALRSLGYIGNTPVSDEPYEPRKLAKRAKELDEKDAASPRSAPASPPDAERAVTPPIGTAGAQAQTSPAANEKKRDADQHPGAVEESQPACVEFSPALTLRVQDEDGAVFLNEFQRESGSSPHVERAANGNDLVLSVSHEAWGKFRAAREEALLPVAPDGAECVRFRLIVTPKR